jgi:casein kinase 1
MIDFGFSKRYIDPHTSRHIADNRKPRDFIGNYWFSSVNVHCNGRVPSRRDDMEAAALMFIHMLTPGGLPWTRNGVPKKDGEHDRLKKEKKQAKPADLCAGLPSEFEDFLRSCRKLKFADCPDYDFWKDEFRNLMEEKGWGTDDDFVWPPPVSAVSSSLVILKQALSLYQSAVRSAAPSKVRTAPLTEDNVEKVLHDLANLNLAARPILGDRMGNANTPPRQESAPKPSKLPIPSRPSLATTASETIDVLSTDSDAPRTQQDKIPEGSRLPKAVQLRRIVKDIGAAVDNLALAHAVDSFVRVLRDTSSRNLTKEGFAVLDAIYKQLADPSVFVAPLRRPTRGGSGVEEVRTPRYTKADQLWKLKRDVDQASTNTELAEVIRVFGKVTDASNGRTLTKDGFSLLEALAGRLKAIA